MNKTCAILQSCYIPWKGYFDMVNSVDEFIVYDCVQYSKNDWRNRNRIKTPSGTQWLTIPVSIPHGLRTRIDEVVATDPAWAKKHWNALVCNYGRAKYFSLYESDLAKLYQNIESNSLSQINWLFLQHVCKLLSISTRLSNATSYELDEDRNMRLVKLCQQVSASVYLSGPAAKAYLDVDLFLKHNITVEWMDYSSYPEYGQLFPPFDHEVSILDLLFNQGSNSHAFMKSFQGNPGYASKISQSL
jgi:WbqC-like protein family